MPEVKAISKNVGASPTRLKPIVDLVRGKAVQDALNTLSLLQSPWARTVSKTIKSASANAENNLLMDPDDLVIVRITADGARSLKRIQPRARGRVGRISKRSSHLTVTVNSREEAS